MANRNGTSKDPCTAGTEETETRSDQMQGERDWMDRNSSTNGFLRSYQRASQSSLSLQSIADPPVLERLVASSWGGHDSAGVEITTWVDITKQNACSGPSIYHEHYSSEEEDTAEELGKVSSIKQAASPVRMDWNDSFTKPNSFDTSKMTAFTKESKSSFSTFQTAAYRRVTTATPPFPLSNFVGANGIFATVKDAAHGNECALESLEAMTLEDDDFDDEMELVQVNTKIGFGIKDEGRKFSAITPSPDILRMQRSPLKTPTIRDSDFMELSPPFIHTRHAFQTVFMPSPSHPRDSHQPHDMASKIPVRVKRSTSTFSYPPPIYLPEESGTTRHAEMPVPPALECKVPSTLQFLPRMPTVESHNESQANGGGKDTFTLLPRVGNFKIRSSKRKESPVEYTLNLLQAHPATTTQSFTSNLTSTHPAGEPDPYQDLFRATSPMDPHPLYAHIAAAGGGGRASSGSSWNGGESHPYYSRWASHDSETSVNSRSKSRASAHTKRP